MTSSNIEITAVTETTRGTTPTTPRMRRKRMTGESLVFRPDYVVSDEIRDDRMTSDSIKVGESNEGGINVELSFPVDGSPESEDLRSLFCASWTNQPFRDNDGTADSAIQGIVAATQIVTVTAGTTFPAGGLVKFSGFGQAANNGLFVVTAASATVPAFVGSGLVDEAAPAAAARMKLVGLQGGAGDLVAVSDGITSTVIDFTDFDIPVGAFVKIGGTASPNRYNTTANNGLARVVAIAAGKLTLDNLPAGWGADTGTGKTIRIFLADDIRNGRTLVSQTFQRRFTGQAVPTCIKQRGMVVNELRLEFASKSKITGSYSYMGLGGTQDAANLDASPDAASTTRAMACGANVGRVNEAGSRLTSPNYVKGLTLTVRNNLAPIEDISELGPVDMRYGDFDVTVAANTYFGDNALLTKFFAGTLTSFNWPVIKDGQALVFQAPRLTLTQDGNPNAGGKNQDVMINVTGSASRDPLTEAHLIVSRFEHYEA